MPNTLYENQQTINNHSTISKNNRQIGQYFTVGSIAHSDTSIKFSLDKAINANTIGTITFDLYAVDGSNFPTGSSLMSGTLNGDTLAADPTYTTIEVTFGSPYNLLANTVYCMVLTAENTSSGNSVNIQDQESVTNVGMGAVYRDFSGSYGAWTAFSTRDMYFLNYGIASSVTITSPLANLNIQGLVPTTKVVLTAPLANLNIQGLVPTLRFIGASWLNLSKNASSATNQSKNSSTWVNQLKS